MTTPTLLPNPAVVQLDYCAADADALCLHLTTHREAVACPECGTEARRVHSRYRRKLADQPWNGQRIRLSLNTRRWFCDRPDCARRIFTEPLPGITARYAQRTASQTHVLRLLAYTLGGEAGARVAAEVGMPVSPDTLLRQLRGGGRYHGPGPRVLGVDDFAWLRGQRYGTLLVDLEQGIPIDLLPDRSADSLAQWLEEHPGVEIISRDRGGSYAEGARQGAPEAVQVADRWHLLKNLTEALGDYLAGEAELLRDTAALPPENPVPKTEPEVSAPASGPAPEEVEPDGERSVPAEADAWDRRSRRERTRSAQSREQRLAQYQQVRELAPQGYSEREIAIRVGISRGTVHKYLTHDTFPERKDRRSALGSLAPYAEYLRRRWDEGCHNAKQLWRELQEQGYRGRPVTVWRFLQRWQGGPGYAPQPSRDPSVPARPAPRAVVWWLLLPEKRTAAQTTYCEQLLARSPEIQLAQELVTEFFRLVRERRGAELAAWVGQAEASGLPALAGFARGLRKDWAAVVAGLTLPWSNGPVEGQINRLKALKRQMYGRASFGLLRARVLPAG